MPTINVSSTSGVVRNTGTVYNTVRTAISGNLTYVGGNRLIGQQLISTTYYIYRVYMAFDTSAITSVPVSATLNIYITISDGFDYIIEDATAPDLTTNISTSDYDAFSGAGFGIAFTPVNGWNTITFDIDPLTLMNTNNIFKISIRSLNEYTNTAPTSTETDTLDFATNVPYISYVSGYANKILSMVTATVNKINSVVNSTILKIDGTPAGYGYLRTPTADGTNSDLTVACGYFIVDGTWVAIYTPVPWANGVVAYSDAALTTPFNGSNFYWGINGLAIEWNSGTTYQISAIGVIGSGPGCLW
jgi:hypothetical protein